MTKNKIQPAFQHKERENIELGDINLQPIHNHTDERRYESRPNVDKDCDGTNQPSTVESNINYESGITNKVQSSCLKVVFK